MQNSPGPLSLTDQHPTPHRPRFSPQCPPGSAKSGSLLVGHLTGKAIPSPQLREAAPRLPCDQRGTLNHPGLARGSASQKSRFEVIRLVKYLPPDSPETRGAPARRRGLGSRGRNAGPAAGRQREPRGPGQAPTPACLRALRLRPRVSEKPGREGGQYGERKSKRVRAPGGSLAPPADKALRETGAQGTDAVGSGEPRRTPGTGARGARVRGEGDVGIRRRPLGSRGAPHGTRNSSAGAKRPQSSVLLEWPSRGRGFRDRKLGEPSPDRVRAGRGHSAVLGRRRERTACGVRAARAPEAAGAPERSGGPRRADTHFS